MKKVIYKDGWISYQEIGKLNDTCYYVNEDGTRCMNNKQILNSFVFLISANERA